jgi:peptidyl-prolyl cis-trans isomerase SurA
MQSHWVMRCACVVAAAIVIAQVPSSRAGAQQDIIGRETITEAEIEQRTKFKQLTGQSAPSRDQVIDELGEEKLKIQHARRWGEGVTDQEVDEAYAQMARRMGQTAEQITQSLARHGIGAETLKHRIRADIASRRAPYLKRRRFEQPKPLRGPSGDHWMPGELERHFPR